MHVPFAKQPINQFNPVQQIDKKALKAYCPNIFTVVQIAVPLEKINVQVDTRTIDETLNFDCFNLGRA